jgi:hypothetical protein
MTNHVAVLISHTYMIHAAMSPVLHVEGCRTLLVSVVVHHRQSGSLVSMSLWLSTYPGCGGTHMVDESSTAPSGQLKGLSAGGRRIFHRGPLPFKGFLRAVDESSAANPTNLSFSALFAGGFF